MLASLSAYAQSDTIRYVNAKTGKYANDGLSWETAKDNVQDAINDLYDYMQRNSVHSGSVYVAAGTYTPSESTGSGSSVLSTSFKIYDGIHVYGGFNADKPETTPDKRVLSNHAAWRDRRTANAMVSTDKTRELTMGELVENEKTAPDTIMRYDFKYATIFSGNHNTVMGKFDWNDNKKQYDTRFPGNSYHVVWFATKGYCNDDAGNATLFADSLVYGASVDGCIIQDGNASGRNTTERDLNAYGGGVYMVQHATLRNCVVRRCSASQRGGGIYMDHGGTVNSCYVYQCQTLGVGVTDGYGGGVCMENNGAVRKTYITNNMARVGGGLMIVYTPEEHPYVSKYNKDNFDPYATTCVISNNNAGTDGAGVALYKGGVLNHCTIVNNECTGTDITIGGVRYGRTGGLYIYGAGSAFNSVVWGNTCKANNDIQYGYNSATDIFKLAEAQRPRLDYMAFSNFDITDWGNSLRNNVFQLDKSNFTAGTAGNYPIFALPSAVAGVMGATYSPTAWKPNPKSYIQMRGVQVSQLTTFGNVITKSHSSRDIFQDIFNPVSALGAVSVGREDYGVAMLPAVDGTDPTIKIPTIFVDPNRVVTTLEGKAGVSWDAPLDNVSEAVYDMSDYISSNSSNSYTGKTQILVKQGDVTAAGPSSYLRDLKTDEADLESAALHLLSNMLMYGGYSSALHGTTVSDSTVASSGTKIVARNPKVNVTRITGNIVGNYVYNSVHCVVFPNVHDAVLDGFYVSYGNAEKPDDPDYNNNDAPETYSYRQAYGYGGGIFIGSRSRQDRDHDMTGNIVRNCVISNCWAPMGGAAVFVSGDNFRTDVTSQLQRAELLLYNCVIHNNAVRNKRKNTINQWRKQGGIVEAVGNASIVMNHCTVVNNVGNVFSILKHNGTITPTISVVNSAIYSNATDSLGDRTQLKADGSNLAALYYGDNAPMGSASTVVSSGNQIDLLYSKHTKLSDDLKAAFKPTFGNVRNDDKTYPRFVNPVRTIFVQQNTDDPTLYGGTIDYTPMDMNPMVNAAKVASGEDVTTETDFALNRRDYGGKPDIGAIENTTQPEDGSTYYVRTTGSNDNDGKSWATAFKTLTYALSQAKANSVKNIWIAAGTYKETSTVNMVAGVNVYGGFKAYGTPGKREGERDISNLDATYQTILDGGGKKRVVFGNNITAATLWEGLTIQNGYLKGDFGSGVYISGTITVKNCLIRNNALTSTALRQGGAGVYLGSSSCQLVDCVVRNNLLRPSSQGAGAGVYMNGGTIINTMIVENAVDPNFINHNILGVGIFIGSSNTTKKENKIYNSTIAYNMGKVNGAYPIAPGIWDDNAYQAKGQVKLYNCIIWGNAGYGNTGESYNAVCRGGWQDAVGKPGIMYSCYHSAPSSYFANDGVTADRSAVNDSSLVYDTNTIPTSAKVPNKYSFYYYAKYVDSYIQACIAKDLFNESKYGAYTNGSGYYQTDNPYSINPASKLAKYCVNMGSETYGTELTQTLKVTEDIAGADRIQDCRIDKGAYEYNGASEIKPEEGTETHKVYSTVPDMKGTDTKFNVATFYVSQNGGGVANASSAGNAACNGKLQQVLDAAGRYKYAHPKDHVIVKLAAVAGGGYAPSRTTDYNTNVDINPRTFSIQIPHGVEVQGGWDDDFKSRDPLNNKTLFTGVFNYDVSTSTAYHVVTFTDYVFDENGNRIVKDYDADGLPIYELLSDSVKTYRATWLNTPGDTLFSRSQLNGCFIEGGEADGVLSENQRGGAAVVTSFADISNCVIQNNSASGYGGGLYVQPAGIVSGCIIQDNKSAYGGGIAIEEPASVNLYTWAVMAFNTIVYNNGSTRGGGLYFNTNLRSIGNVVWQNQSSDQNDISGVVNVDAEQDVWNFPVNYTAVTNVREAGVNNISVTGISDEGVRWQPDAKLKTTDRQYQYYALQKSSVLTRAALPYTTMRNMIRFFPGIDSVDIAGVKRMEQTATGEKAYDGQTELVVKNNITTDIGARAINASYDITLAKVFYRLFVVHPTNVTNDKANALLESDDEIYKQVGSSFANPFQRLGDAFDYISSVRMREEAAGDKTPEKDKPRNKRFEVFVAGGTYYPYTNMYGEQGAVRSNTFNIPEGVTVIGGIDVSKDTHMYCQLTTDKDTVVNGVKLYGRSTDSIRLERVRYDMNKNSVVEPWEMENQTILSGLSVGTDLQVKNVFHVINCNADEKSVGKLPEYFSDDNLTTLTTDASKESTTSRLNRTIILDGLTIRDGSAMGWESSVQNKMWYFRGGGIMIDGTTIDDSTYEDGMGAPKRSIPMVVSNTLFQNNSARLGGAIYTNGQLDVVGCAFVQNYSKSPDNTEEDDYDRDFVTWSGGGAIATNDEVTIANSIFANNEAMKGTGTLKKPYTDMAGKTNNETLGYGGVLWAGDNSAIAIVNCNSVRNKAHSFPSIYNTLPNSSSSNIHIAVNSIFWGNEVDDGGNPKLANFGGDTDEALFFCAYQNGHGQQVKTSDTDLRSTDVTYADLKNLYSHLGNTNNNVIINDNNDAVDGPNFIQPSTKAGVDGFMQSADWLISRVNQLTDAGWGEIDQTTDGKFEKDASGEFKAHGIYPLLSKFYKHSFKLTLLPLGDEKYMNYANDKSEESSENMNRISADPLGKITKDYIDIGVYEYQHSQLTVADGDSVDVIWVSNEEKTGSNTADGRSWDTPTSDLQRAIETLLLSRNDRPKTVKIMGGTYSPTYTLDEDNNGFQIHTGANDEMVALMKKIISGHDYMAQSLTIEGGYSKDIEGARDIEQYPTVLQMEKKSTSSADNLAHLFLISDAEQWKTQGNRSSGGKQGEQIDVTQGGINKTSTPTGYAMPITFDGLTFVNNYASGSHTEKSGTDIGGAAIYYKEQLKTDPNNPTTKTTDELDGSGVPKLTIKNCIFQQNGAEASVPAVRIEKGGGRTLIYNSVFHSGSGNPLECTDTVSIVNCTFAMNGGHIKLSDAATGTSSLYNSIIWQDDRNKGMETQYEGFSTNLETDSVQYNAITGIENVEEDDAHRHNVGLDNRNYNAMEGPNFVNGDGQDVSLRDYHINPGVRTLTRANYLLYARKVLGWVPGMTVKDKDGNAVILDEGSIKTMLADTAYTKDLAYKVRLYDGSMERGAYECSSAMQRVLFVNPSKVTGTMTGLSWQNAYGNGMVQRAIDAAAVYTYFNGKAVGKDPDQARSYVFIKGTSDNSIPETITLRNGVSVYGSISTGFTDEPDAVKDEAGNVSYNNGARIFENGPIAEYVNKVKADRPGLAAKTTLRTRIAGISTMATDYSLGAIVDGFEVHSAKALTAPAISITDNVDMLILRNMMIDGNTINKDANGTAYPVVSLKYGLLYNALVYGNTVAAGQPVVSVGSNGTVLNCTVVADMTGQTTVSNAGNVINSIDYNSADKNRGELTTINGGSRTSGKYENCYASSGNPFAPYLRPLDAYALPSFLTSHAPYYYQLHESSLAIDKGNNNGVPEKYAKYIDLGKDRDVLGNPRTLGGTVDEGCFETWRIADGKSRYAKASDNYYPHEGSVVYIGRDASLSLGVDASSEQIFTGENAFRPGYLLLKKGASLYGNGNVVRVAYVAAERLFPKDTQYALVSMPFAYDYSNAITTASDAMGNISLKNYVLQGGKTYNGKTRSAWNYDFHTSDSPCWEPLPSTKIDACEGWLLNLGAPLAADTAVRFTGFGASDGSYVYTEDGNAKTVTLTQYNQTPADGTAHFTKLENMGWNLKGMPWLVSGYQTYKVGNGQCDMNVPHVLYTVTADENKFSTSRSWVDGSTLDFGSAFFTQTAVIGDASTEDVSFALPKSPTTPKVAAKPFVNISDDYGATDAVEVNAEDGAKALSFNMGSDGVKWQSFNDSVPQLYLIDNSGVALSLAGQAPVGVEMTVGYRAARNGRLTVSLPDATAFDGQSVWLRDKTTGAVTDLALEPYALDAVKGYNDNRLTLTIGGRRPDGTADGGNGAGNSWTVRGVDGRLLVSGVADGDRVAVYTVDGALVEQGIAVTTSYTSGNLDQGVYIVRVNKSSKKVVLRLK